MTNIDAFRINHQSIYLNNDNTVMCAINTIDLATELFNSTYIHSNKILLKTISLKFENHSDPTKEECFGFVLNNLIDKIQITICFENLFKALLLLQGYIIHSLDKNHFPKLSKEQKKRPISLKELQDVSNWKKVEMSDKNGIKVNMYKIKGISETTINYSALINNVEYFKLFEINKTALTLLNKYNRERNNLHLLSSKYLELNRRSFSNYIILENHLIGATNRIKAAIKQGSNIDLDSLQKNINIERIPEE